MTHIYGIDTDIIEIERIRLAIERHGNRFLEKLFTKKEISYCKCYNDSFSRFAGRFAAKEAILKALGTGLNAQTVWNEIEILNNREGKPEAALSERLHNLHPSSQVLISISHCRTYATATALLIVD